MIVAWISFLLVAVAAQEETNYQVGVGRADITGPIVGVNTAGYGTPTVLGGGILARQYSRAFVVKDSVGNTFAYAIIDTAFPSHLIDVEVVKKLQAKYDNMYNYSNVIISATHSHSGPGGYSESALYNLPGLGYVQREANALITGVFNSIDLAIQNLQPANIWFADGDLYNTSINRSPASYVLNPQEERDKYETNYDPKMSLLKFTNAAGEPIGMINWFAVHGTSVNNTNTFINADNKGLAAIMFEKLINPTSLPGDASFVAGFANANLGDVSPNTRGPYCHDTGLPCDLVTSTCGGTTTQCYADGPGVDMYDSCKIIAQNQVNFAKGLFYGQMTKLSGPVGFIKQNVNMHQYQFPDPTNPNVTKSTCMAALGFSFGAGTTDGPGLPPFRQNMVAGSVDNTGALPATFFAHSLVPVNIALNAVGSITGALELCQAPKPILAPLGLMFVPYRWTPAVATTRLLRIGSIIIISAPGEFTTMSGRRVREAVENVVKESAEFADSTVVFAGMCTTYNSYTTTVEEYQLQRYEGASTLYGPNSQAAYQHQYTMLAKALVAGEQVDTGPALPDYVLLLPSVEGTVLGDLSLGNFGYGAVSTQPLATYQKGSTVDVVFQAASPNNALISGNQLGMTFLTVEKQNQDGTWTVVANDGSFETRFKWSGISLLGFTYGEITWQIPADADSGTYRINHYGYYLALLGGYKSYSGTTNSFVVQ